VQQWDSVLDSWRKSESGETLLEWLIGTGIIGEGMLLETLHAALGVEVLAFDQFEIVSPLSPEEQLLVNNGLRVVQDSEGRRLMAGGAELPPDLGQYLGARGNSLPWVLISPLRKARPDGVAEAPGINGSAYGLAGWLKELVAGLHARGAADIHFERTGEVLSVRMHSNGRMMKAGTWSGERAHGCLRLLKRWAGLSTAADSMPQDGRIQLEGNGHSLTFRISHLVTIDGEAAVLRVLGSENEVRNLTELGMPTDLKDLLIDCIRHDPGLLLFCGPTGSGKTTTLYGLLKETAPLGLKVLTIEDPVEYEMPFAVQTAMDEAAGLTFAAAVRAFLRQDPDLIVLGEMRDNESAEAACRAALTGHSVLATLHARDTAAAMDRMADWGLPTGTLSESVRLVVNQRLVTDDRTGSVVAKFSWNEPDRRRPGP